MHTTPLARLSVNYAKINPITNYITHNDNFALKLNYKLHYNYLCYMYNVHVYTQLSIALAKLHTAIINNHNEVSWSGDSELQVIMTCHIRLCIK